MESSPTTYVVPVYSMVISGLYFSIRFMTLGPTFSGWNLKFEQSCPELNTNAHSFVYLLTTTPSHLRPPEFDHRPL